MWLSAFACRGRSLHGYLHELTDGFKAERVISEWIDFYSNTGRQPDPGFVREPGSSEQTLDQPGQLSAVGTPLDRQAHANLLQCKSPFMAINGH